MLRLTVPPCQPSAMNKINPSAILNHAILTPQSPASPARPAMASHDLTPLIPPGVRSSDAARPDVPQWRLALFDRAFDQIRQKLAERRCGDSHGSAPTFGGLSVTELRECDAAAQWITDALMSSRLR